ncbi:MAG: BREX-1 system adenine-specific DNA-methyltransferase PglX [Desulfobulbaceae bacterium]|nr:BREX-1 system adenine-specific DNA-methyltransferase PglX [Pseudomonadota bacterium]MCG2747624.1 BREX-1 system adenine-specific DNA-methyltransferase PglX [Desulfobulbaceae bacterium]
MNTNELKKFAQAARRQLMEQVGARLKLVLLMDSAEIREKEKVVKDLQEQIGKTSKDAVIERVAYIWFNRFCALRFMDVNRYTKIGTVSPAEGFSQPEILQDAKQGHIDDELQVDREKVLHLLGGQAKATDPQQEAYRLLLVAVCNSYHQLMPFMFERIADYTELLMPDDLLSENSILQAVRGALTAVSCQDVEVIGWLYQFYISEKKDQVFAGLKNNKKITPENIPAATQLFTPHWIVRYLVENSLGRLWLLNRPDSQLAGQMDYYIRPEEPETDFLKINSPEEIKICDPACGSGHMLTYTFDLLSAIYEEEGYDAKDIPNLILTKNLYGIEIDERAGELAAFALTMKARAKYRRFFRKSVQPNICVLENIVFSEDELKPYIDAVGRDLFTMNLQTTLHQFQEADNFGSLIRPEVTDVTHIRRIIDEKRLGSKLFLAQTHPKVLRALEQADYLSQKYHVVLANPPYMGGKGMNGRLGAWAKDNYPASKSDLFAMFIERNLDLVQKRGMVAMITMQSWMFLSSFEKLRARLLGENTILSMAHLGARAFDSIGGEVVSTTAFVIENVNRPEYKGGYLRLVDGNSEAEKEAAIHESITNLNCGWLYRASAAEFKKIPGSPIAYWVSDNLLNSFSFDANVGVIAKPRQGMATTNNNLFLRFWSEVNLKKIGFECESEDEAHESGKKWFPYNKGGPLRKWYGNYFHVVNFKNRGEVICNYIDNTPGARVGSNGRVINREFYFKPGITWSDITTDSFAARVSPRGFIFDIKGSSGFPSLDNRYSVLGLLSSKLTPIYMKVLNPTSTFQVGDISRIPYQHTNVNNIIDSLVQTSTKDWDSYETSWDFTRFPLLHPDTRQPTLKTTYQKLRDHWQEMTLDMQRLEEENNRIFIDAYGLQDELTPEVPLSEITLTCNPHYRYSGDKSDEELEALLLDDTLKEFLSYAVGCMFGRYSLDKPGLILANQGQTIEDYLQQIPEPSFPPDKDNVIPILDQDWFIDDITSRFNEFLKVTFGQDHYEENLKFIKESIGKDIRKYFLNDFYKDHLKTYKKRPIYWLFSSPKGSFNALIYMHRYRPDTVSIVLNDYLREFHTKLISRRAHLEAISISASASQTEKTKALKEIEKLKKIIAELDDYERDILYPLATQKIEIDLDDGVKVNYPKFGKALKALPGLSE